MADGTLGVFLSPATAYATKKNIKYPGPTSKETTVESAADTRIEDAAPSGVTVSGLNVTANGEA
jgi:hypothetical protein